MSDALERLLSRVDRLIELVEGVVPRPLTAPDWNASIAYRYRQRSNGHATLEPVRHVGNLRLSDLKEIDQQKEKIQLNTAAFVLSLIHI